MPGPIRTMGAVLVVMASLSAAEAAGDLSFHQLVRELLQQQDPSPHGRGVPEKDRTEMLRTMANAITAASKEAWRDKRNVRGLVVYLLNGGPPAPVRKLLGAEVDLAEMSDVIKAMLAFAEGGDKAAGALARIDPMMLDPVVGASVALAQAISDQSTPARALAYLRITKLLAPGTMLDEAAARREIILLMASSQHAAAAQIAARYFWRFGGSRFADDVASYLGTTLLPDLAAGGEIAGQAKQLLDELPSGLRSKLVLDLARNSLLSGKPKMALHANGDQPPALTGPPDQAIRWQLYMTIANVLSAHDPALTDVLLTIDKSQLDDSDRGVLDAALTVLAQVRAAAVETTSQPDASGPASPTIERARQFLQRADAALNEKNP